MEQIETEEQQFERLVQFIRRALFPDELEILDRCLKLLDTSLLELVVKGNELLGEHSPIIKSTDIPDFLVKLGIADKMMRMNEQERLIFGQPALLVALKLPKIIEEFFSQSVDNNNALQFSKNSLKGLEILHERVEENLDDDKFEKYIVKRKRQVQILDKTVKGERVKSSKLIWNEIYDLNKFSNELKEKDVISSPFDFINIFTNQNICTLRKENIDFVVVLMYALIQKKPSVILTGNDSSRGVLTVVDTFFRDETAIITKTISFTKRHNRIRLDRLKYDKIKDKVDLFLKNHLHKV